MRCKGIAFFPFLQINQKKISLKYVIFCTFAAATHTYVRMRSRFIKKIDIFILKAYLQLFAGTFFICLFIFMMQFLWRYMEDLVGKGLGWKVLCQFFYYSGLTLVPLSLPLAVLLASLISFGNMGERYELLSMKAAGIPLIRILMPVCIFAVLVCGGSFYFQNKIAPEATKQMATLVWSMKQKSPELEIPEGIFYNEIPGYNLFVERKDPETGMLYGVMIYSNSRGYDDAEIVLADSARLQSTADKMHLMLTLHHGERFRNMDSKNGNENMFRANVPYMRESFINEVDIIPFDGNFNIMDANLFSGNAQTKNLTEINHGIDSLARASDSTGHVTYANMLTSLLVRELPGNHPDSAALTERATGTGATPFDSIYAGLSENAKSNAWKRASQKAQSMQSECDFRKMLTQDLNYTYRRHRMEAHKKFTLSLACLLFFFIGAPLGAIIRKGGLGLPVVISVVIFIFYYIINVGSEKLAKTGEWNIFSGIWLSTMVMLPIGLFLTNRANKDSVVFNVEGYRNFFLKLLGLRTHRRLSRKEVIIHEPRYACIVEQLESLSADCAAYTRRARLHLIPNYWKLFFRYRPDKTVMDISQRLELLVEELHNTRDAVILARINAMPILVPDAHTRPFNNPRYNIAAGIVLPVGLVLFCRVWRYRLRLWKDMQDIQHLNKQIIDRIRDKQYE